MKTLIWMILEIMVLVFGIFGFGVDPEIMLAGITVGVIILAVTYFVGGQIADKNKFFGWFVKLFGE